MARLYRKRPVVIEAVRWTGTADALAELRSFTDSSVHVITHAGSTTVEIHTLEGVMTASLGDWIIKGIAGEFYPCKPDIFEESYEKVDTAEPV